MSDLHIGFEIEFSSRGLNLPSQTKPMLERLSRIIDAERVDRLVLLGDVKHGISKIQVQEWSEVPEFLESLLKMVDKVEVVIGNHDAGLENLIPRGVKLHGSGGMMIKSGSKMIGLVHGHAWPSPELFSSDLIVMAHHHFAVEFRDSFRLRIVEPVWVLGRMNRNESARRLLEHRGFRAGADPVKQARLLLDTRIRCSRILVMPAFNRLLGGLIINTSLIEEDLSPLLKPGVTDLPNAEIYLLDGTYLGRLSSLSLGDLDKDKPS